MIRVESRSKAATLVLCVDSSSVFPWPSYRPTNNVAGTLSSGARSDQTTLGWSFFWEVGLKKSATAPPFPCVSQNAPGSIEMEWKPGEGRSLLVTLLWALRLVGGGERGGSLSSAADRLAGDMMVNVERVLLVTVGL